MDRPKLILCVRITASAGCLVLCVLLVGLWARSYERFDWLGGLGLMTRNNEFQWKDGCLIESANGVLVVMYAGNGWERALSLSQFAGSSMASPNLRVTIDEGESAWNGFRAKTYPNGIFRGSAPHWFVALIFGVLAAALRIRVPYRFSLRTLMIASTLVAVILGAVVIAAR